MANTFSKEERVMFDEILEGFEDSLVNSRTVSVYNTDGTTMERANDTIWRPVPYILNTENRTVGTAPTAQDVKQLSVPATIGYKKVAPWSLTGEQLRDASQQERLTRAAYQRLASDVNTAVRDVAALQGSLVVPISTAAGTYNDIAEVESVMNEQGIPEGDRTLILSTRDYNGMSGDLANRSNMTDISSKAYRDSYVGKVAGFETLKTDAGKRLTAAAGSSITMDTTGAQIQYAPKSSESTTAGEINVDNRYQTITVSATTNVAAGDCFTIAGIESVHHIHKEATGNLKTFRVISVDSGTTMTISPPIIAANSSPTDIELAYKNVEATSTSGTAAITFLNVATASVNPFWHKDSIEILPSGYVMPSGAGLDVMSATIDPGFTVLFTKQADRGLVVNYNVDVRFGVVNTNPEMNGILMFGQT